MSFFITKLARKAKKTGADKLFSGPVGGVGKQQAASLNRLGCAACPLNKATDIITPKMEPTLKKGGKIYFLAEAPGRDEDEDSGRPLTGPSGKLLRECIPAEWKHECSFDNVVNCRPTKNRTPVWQEWECCRPRREKYIQEAKPLLIVGLGAIPLQAVLGSQDMQGMRGRIFAVKWGGHACWFLPTYHPSFILRVAKNKRKPLNSMMGHCFRMDLKRAFDYAQWLEAPNVLDERTLKEGIQVFDGQGRDHESKILGLLEQAEKAKEKAYDIETKGLRPYKADAAIMSAAFSFENTHFSFALDHPKAGWAVPQKERIKKALKAALLTGTKIAHNASFEVEWMVWCLGRDILQHEKWHCTQMECHFLDERRGKSKSTDDADRRAAYQALKFLVKQYFGIDHKSVFKLNKKDMSKSDLDETLIYNCADTKVTLMLHKWQRSLLKRFGLWEAYLEARPRQTSAAMMQALGVHVDQAEVKKAQNKLKPEIKKLEADIASLKVVQAYVRDHKEFNPLSPDHAIEIFKDYLHRPEVEIKPERHEAHDFNKSSVSKKRYDEGKGSKYSVDKNVLDQIDHPLAKMIVELRNRTKLKSTYVDDLELEKGELVYPDGLIHCNFNMTFAETGRTSCVAEWTPIKTITGQKQIKDIGPGDWVWTHKGRWRRVTKQWRKGFERMLNIRLSNGSILTCTKIHRLLLSDGRWATAGELYDFFKEMGKRPGQCKIDPDSLPQQRGKISRTNCSGIEYKTFQYTMDYKETFDTYRVQDFENLALLSVQNWRQKPHDWKVFGTTPSMEGRMRRWSGIPDNKNSGRENLCTPQKGYGCAGIESHPTGVGSTPHRQQSTEQQLRQFGTHHKSWSSINSLKAAAGQQGIEIEEINLGPSCEVFDITVEEDRSYEACGVFSHNSDDPNMQNFPKRNDEWVRNQVVAPDGHVFLAFDYGQLEACTAAMCSRDKVLVKALWEDYDTHMEWSIKLVHEYPSVIGGKKFLSDKDTMENLRGRVKNKLVFPAIFGAQNSSIAGYLDLPEEVIDRLMDEFWKTFHGLAGWQDKTMKTYYNVGYVESPTGRRRHYPMTRNQAINDPIQSVACDIVCRSMNTLSQLAAEEGKWHLHPIMNIHDDLTFCVPDNDKILETAITDVYSIMLAPGYDFINVPLSVTGSIGKHWFGMQKIDKFWSHKDL